MLYDKIFVSKEGVMQHVIMICVVLLPVGRAMLFLVCYGVFGPAGVVRISFAISPPRCYV